MRASFDAPLAGLGLMLVSFTLAYFLGSAVGAALGPPIVVLSLAGTSSWRAAFAAMGLAFLAMGLLITVRRRDWVGAAIVPTGPALDEAPGPTNYGRAMLLLAGPFLLAAG